MPDMNQNSFLDTVVTSSNSVEYPVVPEGAYGAYISELKTRSGKNKDGGTWSMMDVIWTLTDQEAIEILENPEPKVMQSFFLDFTPEGGLDFAEGKNVKLGRLREALGQNQDGVEWRPMDMYGQNAIIHISHRQVGEDTFMDVKRVTAAEQ